MLPRLLDPNRARIVAIRHEAGLDDAEALARLFEDRSLRDDGTLAGRLRSILAATERRTIKGLQTGLRFSDRGFRGDRRRGGAGFRDPWRPSRNQVGHFLTAAGLAFRPSLVSDPVLGRPLRDWLGADRALPDVRVALRLVIGHELAPDPGLVLGALVGGLSGGATARLLGARGRWSAVAGALVGALAGAAAQQVLGFRGQFLRATSGDEAVFDDALAALGSGPSLDLDAAEAALRPILARIDVDAPGNSHQDLRLSLLGWHLGDAVRRGNLSDRTEAAVWIRTNLGERSESRV